VHPSRRARPAVAIFGKSQGTKPENLQLRARVGLAAAIWHASAEPRPILLYVPADHAGPEATPDADVVRELLTGSYGVPDADVVTRRLSNCTYREVRWLRSLCAELGLGRLTAVTHGYHAARTARYLEEVLPGRTGVVSVTVPELARLGVDSRRVPARIAQRFAELPELIERSQPRGVDALREALVEGAMTVLHVLDRRGRVEIALADRFRNPPPG
jgi:hypothetical protein